MQSYESVEYKCTHIQVMRLMDSFVLRMFPLTHSHCCLIIVFTFCFVFPSSFFLVLACIKCGHHFWSAFDSFVQFTVLVVSGVSFVAVVWLLTFCMCICSLLRCFMIFFFLLSFVSIQLVM